MKIGATRRRDRPRTRARDMARTSVTRRSTYARCVTACVAALALATAGNARADDSSDVAKPAHVLVHKRVVEPLSVQGENMTISITLVNAGETEARKVKVSDKGFPETDFELITGKDSLSATYATLEAGASEEYSFVVVPKTSGTFNGGAASVSYLASSGREVTHGASNVVSGVPIYTALQKKVFTALKIGRWLTLGVCKTMEDWIKYATIFGSIGGILLLNWFALKVKKGVAAARRKLAVASLERGSKKTE